MRIRTEPDQQKDYSALSAVLLRTNTSGWAVELKELPQGLLNLLDSDPAMIEKLTEAWDALGRPLPRRAAGVPGATLQREELPAQEGWVRVVALSLQPFPALQQATSVDAEKLADLVDRDPLLRALCHWAGRAKDGAMDLRALLGAYGWFQIGLVLSSLRRRLRTLDEAGQQALLADFAPMLTLLAEAQAEKSEGRAASDEALHKAAAEADEAEEMAFRAETEAKLRSGDPVQRAELRELVQTVRPLHAAPVKAAARAPKGRKTPRGH